MDRRQSLHCHPRNKSKCQLNCSIRLCLKEGVMQYILLLHVKLFENNCIILILTYWFNNDKRAMFLLVWCEPYYTVLHRTFGIEEMRKRCCYWKICKKENTDNTNVRSYKLLFKNYIKYR